jgi:hypothetical protein
LVLPGLLLLSLLTQSILAHYVVDLLSKVLSLLLLMLATLSLLLLTTLGLPNLLKLQNQTVLTSHTTDCFSDNKYSFVFFLLMLSFLGCLLLTLKTRLSCYSFREIKTRYAMSIICLHMITIQLFAVQSPRWFKKCKVLSRKIECSKHSRQKLNIQLLHASNGSDEILLFVAFAIINNSINNQLIQVSLALLTTVAVKTTR